MREYILPQILYTHRDSYLQSDAYTILVRRLHAMLSNVCVQKSYRQGRYTYFLLLLLLLLLLLHLVLIHMESPIDIAQTARQADRHRQTQTKQLYEYSPKFSSYCYVPLSLISMYVRLYAYRSHIHVYVHTYKRKL